MNRTSRSSSEVRIAARSPARSMAGPGRVADVDPELPGDDRREGRLAEAGRAVQEDVVGGLSPPLAACSSTDRLALTSVWPMYSASVRGRRLPSTTRSASSSRSADRMRGDVVDHRVGMVAQRGRHFARMFYALIDAGRSPTTRLGFRDYHARHAPVAPIRVRPPRADRPRPPRRRRAGRAGRPGPAQQPADQVPRADHGHAQARRDRAHDARRPRRLCDGRRPVDGHDRAGRPPARRGPRAAALRLAALLQPLLVPGRGAPARCAT